MYDFFQLSLQLRSCFPPEQTVPSPDAFTYSSERGAEGKKKGREEEDRQEERIKRKAGSSGGFAQRYNNAARIMRYTGDECSPMYRIMIHDEYGMTMRDLIRECMLVIGPNTADLPWRYWTVLGPAPFHTLPLSVLSSFRRLRTTLDCRNDARETT